MKKPLMPRATAAWLIENTSLSFEQIAHFCALPLPEIQSIADGDVAMPVQPRSPISSGELMMAEIERCQMDPSARLQMREFPYAAGPEKRKGGHYTPLIKRQNKPDAIAWILKYHPELSDKQIIRLLGTTRPTIVAIRERSHRNMTHINPSDPVILGLCTQTALNEAVAQAQKTAAHAETESATPSGQEQA